MPLGDKIRGRRRRPRLVHEGDEFTIDEEGRGEVELVQREPLEEQPPVDVQGEPWGWKKGPPYPRGYPGPDHSRDDPGPFDGLWETAGGPRCH